MQLLNIIVLLFFAFVCIGLPLSRRYLSKKYTDYSVIALSLVAGLAFIATYFIGIARVIGEGGFIPFQEIGARDISMSFLLLLDICGMFSLLTYVFYPILHFKHKGNAELSMMKYIAPIGFIGGLLSIFATSGFADLNQLQVSADPSLNSFVNLLTYTTIGYFHEPTFYINHFAMSVICIYVVTNKTYHYGWKNYGKLYLTIGTYVLYVLLFKFSLGLNQGVSAMGFFDFFESTNTAYYAAPWYKIFVDALGINAYPAISIVAWVFFIMFAHIVVLSKNSYFWITNKTQFNNIKSNFNKIYLAFNKFKKTTSSKSQSEPESELEISAN